MAAKKVTKGTLKSASGRGASKTTIKASGKAEAISLGKINAATGSTASREGKSKTEMSKDDFKKVSGAGPSTTKIGTYNSTPTGTGKFKDATVA